MKGKNEIEQTPEAYWEDVIKTNKFNIKGEEANIEKYTKGKGMLDKQITETEKGLALDLEETELIRKLYPKHGKSYEGTEEFKKFFDRKLGFILANIKTKGKAAREQYVYQLKVSAQSISESERLIKEYKGRVREARLKKKDSIKDKNKMFG